MINRKLKAIIDELSCSEKEKITTYREICFLFGVSEWRDLNELPKPKEKVEVMYEDYTTDEGDFVCNEFEMLLKEAKDGKRSKPVKWRYSIS